VVKLLVEVLFLAIKEFDFLIDSESDCVDCGLLVLWFLCADLNIDAFRF